MSETRPARAVAVVPDLFFQARIREVAGRAGVPLTLAPGEEALREALEQGDVGLVIVSLEARDPDPFRILKIASAAPGVRTVGFFSHVMEDLREKALAAGCHRVMGKGAFTRGLEGVLRQEASK